MLALFFASATALAASAGEGERFPLSPDGHMTPGSVCAAADAIRYPERIKYCERNVKSERKNRIIETYDLELGFHIREMNRMDFKIDHLIPLCMGGSNESDNLWPQHKSVYEKTDPLEPMLCDLMAQGKLKQSEAIELILEAKADPMAAADQVRARLGRMNSPR